MLKSLVSVLLIFGALFSGCRLAQPEGKAPSLSMPGQFRTATKGDTSLLSPAGRAVFFDFDSDLLALIDTALLSNLDMKIAFQRVERVRSEVVLNRGVRSPDLSVNVGAGVRRISDYTMDGVGNFDTRFSTNLSEKQRIPEPILPDFSVGFQSNWEVDVWGKLKSRKKAAMARFLASENGRNLVLTNLVSDVALAYFELRALDYELEILRENMVLQRNAVEIVRVQKEAGMANELGVEIMEAQLLASQEKEAGIRQQVRLAENHLNFLLGRYPRPIRRRGSFLADSLPPGIKAGIPSAILRNRPDILQAEQEVNAAHADLESARTAFYPSFTLGAGMGYQAFSAALLLETPASFVFNALGGLTAPLLNRRRLKADLLSADSEKKIAYLNYEKTVIQAFGEVYNHLYQVEASQERARLKSQEVNLLRNSIQTSSDLFRTGRANYLEVVNAQKNALQSQLELAELKKLQFRASIDLYRSLGGGWR